MLRLGIFKEYQNRGEISQNKENVEQQAGSYKVCGTLITSYSQQSGTGLRCSYISRLCSEISANYPDTWTKLCRKKPIRLFSLLIIDRVGISPKGSWVQIKEAGVNALGIVHMCCYIFTWFIWFFYYTKLKLHEFGI